MVFPILSKTLFLFVRIWIKKINGLENLKKAKSFVVACNHASFADDLIMPVAVITYLNKYLHTYCNDRFYKNFFLRKFLENGRCIPVRVGEKSEESARINNEAFDCSVNLLNKNEPVALFPEGQRSLDGKLLKAKTGVARLALKSRVPVVPIGVIGSYDILPKHAKFPKFKRCTVNIGKPMFFDKYYGKENNKKVLDEVTTDIMKEIAKLAGLKYEY